MLKRKGQSTLEYITVFAVIVAAVLVLAWTALRPAVLNMFNRAAGKITNSTRTF